MDLEFAIHIVVLSVPPPPETQIAHEFLLGAERLERAEAGGAAGG